MVEICEALVQIEAASVELRYESGSSVELICGEESVVEEAEDRGRERSDWGQSLDLGVHVSLSLSISPLNWTVTKRESTSGIG